MVIKTSKLIRPNDETTRLSVGFILAKRFTLSAFANFVDVIRLSADEGDQSRPILCNWTVLSDNMDTITSSCGVAVQPKKRLGDPTEFDYIVVVGGLMDETPDIGPAYSNYLNRAAELNVPLVGICTGAFFLHQAGLLKGYKCCVSWFHNSDFLEQFEGLNPVSDQIFVVDRDRITCAGGASSAHLAAYLVDRHVGHAQAAKALRIMIIDDVQKADKPQPGIVLEFKTKDPLVQRALLIMQQNIDAPLSIDRIARRLGLNKRQVERHFRNALDTSPQSAFQAIRLSFAKHLVVSTQKPIAQIAVDCGFCDASHLNRNFKQKYGQTPNAMRNGQLVQ